MKTMIKLIAISCLLSAICFSAFAQGTAFSYQGRLNANGSPASGNYDFRFRLDADPLGNTILGTMLTNAIPVTNGLFATTIDFGAGLFTDTQPLPATAAKWIYTAIYRRADARVGQWSAPVSITVAA
jgi:hypothetical protein